MRARSLAVWLTCLAAVVFCLVISVGIAKANPTNLDQVQTHGFVAAGVLPVTPDGQWLLLGREHKQHADGSDYIFWDAFSGSREPEEHPRATAAREASEESMGALGTPAELEVYIHEKAENTKRVIIKRGQYYPLFVTRFSQDTLANLFVNWFPLRRGLKAINADDSQRAKLEKRRVAWVRMADLKYAIGNANVTRLPGRNSDTFAASVPAIVLQKDGMHVEAIRVRESTVSTLRPYFAQTWEGQDLVPKPVVRFCTPDTTQVLPLPRFVQPPPLQVNDRPRADLAPVVAKGI